MKKNILCIERSNSICFLIETVLKDQYLVKTAFDGFEGIRVLNSHYPVNLVILSIDSPTDDNVGLLQHIKTSSLFKDMPVIIISSFVDDFLNDLCNENNVLALFSKPFDPLKLLYVINNQLETTKNSEILPQKRKVLHLN